MAVHSPAIGALNKLLLSQIALIQQFLATSRRATEQLSSSIESGYQYTTLEETKEVSDNESYLYINYIHKMKLLSLVYIGKCVSTKSIALFLGLVTTF